MIHPMRAESPFGELLKQLWRRHQNGLTAHMPLERYLHYDAKTESILTWSAFANVGRPEELNLEPGDPFKVETPTDHLRDDLEQLARKTA